MSYWYGPRGSATGWTNGNGSLRSYTYDLNRHVTGISTKYGTTVLQSLTYGYNANAVIAKITNGVTPA